MSEFNMSPTYITSKLYMDYAWIKDNDVISGNFSPAHLCKKLCDALYTLIDLTLLEISW